MQRKIFVITTLLVLVLGSCKKNKEEIITGDVNKFDARYSIAGTVVDVEDSRINAAPAREYHLKTISSTEIEMFSPELGISGHVIRNIANLTFYAKFSIIVKFDPATNKIVSVRNGYGQPSDNGRSTVLDPSGVNAWDPVTKNITIKYWMDQVGVVGHKASFDETWTYIGPR